VLDELSGNKFIHYQKWQNQLLNIAIHPMAINQTKLRLKIKFFKSDKNGVVGSKLSFK
jgi:hypothetical protein